MLTQEAFGERVVQPPRRNCTHPLVPTPMLKDYTFGIPGPMHAHGPRRGVPVPTLWTSVAHNTQPASAPRPWQARLPFFYGWIVVGLGFFGAFFGIGLTWAAGLFAVPMQDEMGWSRSAYFFGVSLRGWIGIVVSPLMGSFLDRKDGPRTLMLIGGLLNSLTLAAVSQVHEQWQFALLFGVIGGVAQTVQSGISVAIVPKWFIKRRGFAVAISTTGGGLAAFIMPTLISVLNTAVGWRDSWIVLGVLALIFATLPVILLCRQPEDIGLLPDGEKVPAPGMAGPVRVQEVYSFTLKEALHTNTFWLLMVGVSIGSLANNGIPANMANIFVDRGFTLEDAGVALTLYGVGSITTKFVVGWIANRVHIRPLLIGLTAFGALVTPSLLLFPPGIGSWALGYGLLVGLFVGAYVPMHQLVWSVYFGRGHVGAISGVARPMGIILISGSPFMLAFLRDSLGSYDTGILVVTVAVAVCSLCLYLVRPPKTPLHPGDPAPAAG
ncbi:MAG: MFS transporter [Dehalococcoidia bacterium]|nr:MFS transporter [Dehalococcoidia bacterium]